MTVKKIGLVYAAIHAEQLGSIREISADWSEPEVPFILGESLKHLESGMLYTFRYGGVQGHRTATELEEPTKEYYDQIDLTVFSRQGASVKANRRNLDSVDFILRNDLDSTYYREAHAIRQINTFLKNEFEAFDFEKAVRDYRVELKGSGACRVGKEDKAWIAIESTNYLRNRTWDTYLTALLPIIHTVICEDCYYSRWEFILEELKDSLGTETIKKLEMEASQMEAGIKEGVLKKYNKEAHKTALLTATEKIRDQILAAIEQHR